MKRRIAALAWPGIVFGIAVLVAWTYSFPYFEGLNNPNENVRVYLTRAIVENHTFAINEIIDDWGYVNDKAINDEGQLFPGKAPGTSFLAVPAYWVMYQTTSLFGGEPSRVATIWVCRMSASIIPVLVFLLAFARFLRLETPLPSIRLLGLSALAMGSTMLPYGLLCTSHSLIAACIFAGILLVEEHRARPESIWVPLLSGFLLALAITLEYPAAIGVGVVAIATIFRAKNRGSWIGFNILGGLAPILLLMYFHYCAFGSPLETAYSNLENPEFRESVSPGFFGLERVQGDAVFGTWLAPWNGLFWFMPWTAVVVPALLLAIRVRDLRYSAAVTVSVLVAYAIFVSMVDNWRGGWTAGPRYIVPVMPFLAWYLTKFLAATSGTRWAVFWFTAVAALVAVAIVNCGVSAFVFPHYPEQLMNPIAEIGFFMLAHGYSPHTIGEIFFDFDPWFALIPLGIALTVAATLPIMRSERLDGVERSSMLIIVGVVAYFILRAQALPQTPSLDLLSSTRTTVVNLWEPRQSATQVALHNGSLPDTLLRDPSAAELLESAHWAAFEGFDDTALSLLQSARAAASEYDPSQQLDPSAEPDDETATEGSASSEGSGE